MGRKLGLFFMMILLVGCTDNTRPASNLKQSENVALQKMADAHNATVKDAKDFVNMPRDYPTDGH
jgi:ABC-type enterochelin transport system substrate-binding protein